MLLIMGANCCIAAKERSQPCLASVEVSAYRIRHSPSWNFRWDNRTHIEDIMQNNTVFSNHSSGNIQPELKSGSITPTEGHTGGDSLSDVFRRVKRQKSDKKMEASKLSKVDPRADQSTTKNSPPEANSHKSLDMVTVASDMKTSKSPPSAPSLVSKAKPADPSSSMSHSIHMDPNSIRKACWSPGHQLDRQISDGNIPSLKTLSENSSAEIIPSSSMLSACSNDMFSGLSYDESSDGWSTRTPSELVATSQNERVGSIAASKLPRSNASDPTALSPNQEVCKLCSRLLKERSSWNGHELAVVAVLFCGHAYHANCLDSITAESEKYDPPCPVCTHGETCTAKLFGKLESKIKNKTSKNMAGSDLDRSSKHQKKSMREPRLGTSSSIKDSFSRPFLRRHFSTGSRPPRSVFGGETTRKKGFWSRHWRE
ncbi:uncharacterized protein LOC133909315 [Phragmites australis]|uniref:uncharacterized protein LOC133909315 n=1 Tax=Phragmites australis TaxID=29695 RepID=UPI002D76AE42|nr:uncharacterized protein LOC133909315 [Phragmites australis]